MNAPETRLVGGDGASVLVVDDEEVVRRSFQRVLAGAGYRVRAVASGGDALAASGTDVPDLVLADLKMPGMDGLTLIRRLLAEHPGVRVITITGYPSEESAAEARTLGVERYLTKPLSPESLLEAAAAALVAEAEAIPPYVPTPQPGPAVAVPVVEVAASRAATEFWKGLGMLVAAPFIGLAYVVFLPLAGFWVVTSEGVKALGRRLRRRGKAVA